MAPLSGYAAQVLYEAELHSRSVDTAVPTGPGPFTSSQRNTLQCLALAFATISVASAILAFYWFVRMRRSFRHDLIMLLIQSDMFKALWFMVYPIVAYAHGPVMNDSIFCQVNGFFLAIGIEASDIAVTMIAIHSALYIIKPRAGEGGLYPHRRIAYTIWAVLPIAMASLAFVRDKRPYVGQGAYCYLPLRPLWYSLALSWVPRYLIFIVILVLYASIYSYVRYRFSGFTKLSKRISVPPNDQRSTASKESGLPSSPPLITHNSNPNLGQTFGTGSERSVTGSYDQVPISPEPQAHRFMWASFVSGETSTQTESTIPSLQRTITSPSEDYFTTQSSPQPLVGDSPPSMNDRREKPKLPSPPDQAHLSSQQPQNLTSPSGIDIFTLLNQRPEEEEDDPAPVALQLVSSRGPNVAIAEMIQTRDKIRRQLRHLFIYPLAYIGMWLIPLVCQILQFDDRFAAALPFGLRCVSTICLCSQAAIECWLFSSREKPWKHIPQTKGNFSSSLRFWAGWSDPAGEVKAAPRPGRTKDEVVRETRAAYQRRNEEIAQRQSESEQPRSFNLRGDRMWWDAAGMETAMTPVFEEPVNPMDSILAADSPPMEPSPRRVGIRTLRGGT